MIQFPRRLTHLEVPQFSKILLQQAPQSGIWALNLSEAQVIDSAFLALLLMVLRHCNDKKIKLQLHGLTDNVKSLLEVYGIYSLFAKYFI